MPRYSRILYCGVTVCTSRAEPHINTRRRRRYSQEYYQRPLATSSSFQSHAVLGPYSKISSHKRDSDTAPQHTTFHARRCDAMHGKSVLSPEAPYLPKLSSQCSILYRPNQRSPCAVIDTPRTISVRSPRFTNFPPCAVNGSPSIAVLFVMMQDHPKSILLFRNTNVGIVKNIT